MIGLGLLGVPEALLAAGYGLVAWGAAFLAFCTVLVVGGCRLLRQRSTGG